MAKKKAGAAKALKDESDEARMLRLEMEGLAAEERARVQAEATRVALRAKQAREQHHAHINSIKLHNQWRKIMRFSKVEELRGEIEILAQTHEREVDHKDALVQLLDRDLEEAEEQHQTALGSHLMVLDSLLDLQAARLAGLERQFNAELKGLMDEAAREAAEVNTSFAKQKRELQEMAQAMKVEFGDAESDARQEFESVREEVRNRDSEEYNVLKIQLEGIIDELERHFEQAHRAYLDGTDHRTAAFKQLTASDAAAARVIEQRMKKLLKLQEDLQHWRTKIATNTREWEARNAALRREKDLLARHYAQLKAALDRSRAAAAERLKQLSLMSGGAINELRGQLSKAESILKLASLCRKLETEQEKVLPFCSLNDAVPVPQQPGLVQLQQLEHAQEQQAQVQQQEGMQPQQQHGQPDGVQAQPPQQQLVGPPGQSAAELQAALERGPLLGSLGVDEAGRPVGDWEYLNRFFKRFNKATLDVAAVSRERGRLEQENADLRQLLRTFLDGISVNDAVLASPANPLLVVNQRMQLTVAAQRKQRGAATAAKGGAASPAAHDSPVGLLVAPAARATGSSPSTARTARSTLSAGAAAALAAGSPAPAPAPPVQGGLVMSPRAVTAPQQAAAAAAH